uniref:Methyltransferase type 11 domain-containing protein n=1 Tax=Glycine max TaxID=3847 RepID=A0A0R0L4J8_SOYBN
MTNFVGLRLHTRLSLPLPLPVLGGASHSCSATATTLSRAVIRKWNWGIKGPRRMIKGGPSVDEILKNVEWPEQFPFKEEEFQRFDETPDSLFYEAPRFVTHIDDPAIAALTKYYSKVFPPSNTPGVSILDMCSSWVLTEYAVQDLNVNPKLPFEDNSFDLITNVVSVDYLTKPLDVFKEMCRILKPGGLAIMSFSNRCFWTKAISIWTSTGDADHVMIVGSYFHYAGGFEPPQAVDISPNPGRSDPMYIVYSRKLSTA